MTVEIQRAARSVAALALSLSALLAVVPVRAQQTPEHDAHHPTASDKKEAPMADGEVRRIDKEQGKLTLRHGEMTWLDMPPMTMVFRVADAALLDQVKVGDKVRFAAEKRNGLFTVTQIEPAK